MASVSTRTALIVGAGIGGLAAGLTLRRAGWQVRIFERAASPRELGFALGLAPNAMAALRELGLADAVRAEGVVPHRAELRRGDGRVLRRFDVGAARKSVTAVVALRPVLHGALLAAVGSEALVLASEAAGFEAAGGRVVLTLADGRTATGEVLIGADGVGSVIRRQLHPDEPPPRRSGHYAFRGVALDVGHYLGDLDAVVYFGHGIEVGTVRASRSAIYWYVSVLARSMPTDTRDVGRVLERCAAGLISDERFWGIARATKQEDLRLDELFDRDPIDDWGRGPVTLLGDAAHPMLPHTAQGAAQALEDAVALGLALAPEGDVVAALCRYERVRSARTRRIVALGRRIARVTTTRNAAVGWLRDAVVRIVPALMLVGAFQLGGQRDPHRELRPRG